MNNTVLGIFSILFILIGAWLLSFTDFGISSVYPPAKFSFTDGAFKSKSVDAFSFEKDGIFATIPAPINGELKKVAAHFKSNENRILSLVGTYYATEKYRGESNLGKERAEAIKAKLVKYGTPADKITTSGKELIGKLEGRKIYNAVIFEGNEKVEEEAAALAVVVVEIPAEVKFSPSLTYTVYFDSGSSKLEMTPNLKNYLDQASEYLKQNSGAGLSSLGYLDKEENTKSNKTLSRDRARRIRTFLVENGIKKRRVSIRGLDEKNPIAPNETEEGKALNRRVEITIK
jgi:OOP family OmpA-OmpF porin